LLDAATKLFESQGYFCTTVEQIANEAAVSKGLVYNYFNSKEELLAALIEAKTNQMAAVAETLISSESIEESLSRFLDRYLIYLRTEKRFLKLQLTLMLMPELKQVVAGPQRERATLLLGVLSDWFRQAGASQPTAKARLVLAMLDGVALHYLFVYVRYPLNTVKPQLMRAIRDICEEAE